MFRTRVLLPGVLSVEKRKIDMEQLLTRLESEAGLAREQAEKTVAVILAFLQQEAPSAAVEKLVGAFDGAEMLAQKHVIGLMPGMGAMGAFQALSALGLGMGEIQVVTRAFMDEAASRVGDEVVGEIVSAIPGLEQFL